MGGFLRDTLRAKQQKVPLSTLEGYFMFDRLKRNYIGVWLGAVFVSLVLGACSSSEDVTALEAQANAAYQQDANGGVMIEAERNQGSVDKSGHRWQLVSKAGARGGKAMQALPDTGANYSSDFTSRSPRLDYQVNFSRAGIHTVQVRGEATQGSVGNSDSVHIGLDGNAVASADKIAKFRTAFHWTGKTRDGVLATINVPSAGLHTVNVWMREDGFTFDALQIRASANSNPALNPNPTTRPGIPSVRARSAASFIDTMGVNTHLHYQNTVYDTRYKDLIKPRLLELGIKHIRDGTYTHARAENDEFYYQRLRELAATGIRFTLGTALTTSHGEGTDLNKLADVFARTNGAVAAFEGLNEPDLFISGDWIGRTREAQKRLYETVKGNPALRNVKVIGPSPVWEAKELGDLSRYLDYGNSHPYLGGKSPTDDEHNTTTWTVLAKSSATSSKKPIMITETGYHNAVNTSGTHPPASEEAAAIYLPRLFLENFNRGVPRTYLYELIDSKPANRLTDFQASFGLLRYDGSEKPGYRAVANLTKLLADSNWEANGSLNYKVSGDTQNLHQTLLQKGNGTFYLALWLEKSAWDRHVRKGLYVSGQKVTVTLGSSVSGAALHTFDGKGQVYEKGVLFRDGQLTLDVDDTVRFLELRK